MAKKEWYLSPIAFLLSLFSKPLTVEYIPLILVLVWRSDLEKKRKIILAIPYGVLMVLVIVAVFAIGADIVIFRFDIPLLIGVIGGLSTYLANETLFWLSLLPIYGGLFLLGLKRTRYGQCILFLVGGTIISFFILEGFTDISSQPYRIVPLVVISSVGLGALFSTRMDQKKPNSISTYNIIHAAIFVITTPAALLMTAYVLFPTQMTAIINNLIRAANSIIG